MLALLDSVLTQGTAALSQDGLYQLSLGFYLVYVEKNKPFETSVSE